MPRRATRGDPEDIRTTLVAKLEEFGASLRRKSLRGQVIELIYPNHLLRDLGCSLVEDPDCTAARDRILYYFRHNAGEVVQGDELMVVAGISEYARRVRELRVQFGWPILSGKTLQEMRDEESEPDELENAGNDDDHEPSGNVEPSSIPWMKPHDYILYADEQDKEAAHRWHVANEIRRYNVSVKEKILRYLQQNVGRHVTNEELRYVAKDRSEWARRARELRTEEGWPVVTQQNGNPTLPIGVYVLERNRQNPTHDRNVSDKMRRRVLQRDGYRCYECGWSYEQWNPSDPRNLEVHHIVRHAEGGANEDENLIAVCNVCHDEIHIRDGYGSR